LSPDGTAKAAASSGALDGAAQKVLKMRSCARLVSLVLLLVTPTQAAERKTPAERRLELTSDSTRQLIISGGELKQRMPLMRLLEGLRETTLRVLRQPQQSYPKARPILCVLGPEDPFHSDSQLEIIEDPGGLKLQLKLPAAADVISPHLQRTLLSALLTEMAIRPFAESARPPVIPPAPRWLVDVLFHEHHRPNPLFAPINLRELLDAGDIPSPLPLLTRPESEPVPSSPVETDLARCLLSFFLNRPEGPEGIQSLLRTDLTEKTFQTLLTCFPNLPRSESQFLREWTVHVAASGTQAERVALDGPQTEVEIRDLLLFDHTSPETGVHSVFSLEQFTEILRLPGANEVLLARQLEWESLRSRAHFLYYPIIDAYAYACNALAAGRTAGILRKLQLATLERESVAARLDRIRDHLNWYEAVAAPRKFSPRLAEFYRILEAQPQVSSAVKAALDKAELELRQSEARHDIENALDEVRNRPKQPK
jgi:hypothetical protein